MLAGEEADPRRQRIAREGERERHLDRRAVRALALALEVEHVEVADPGLAKRPGVGPRLETFEHQHRKPLPARQCVAVERAERKGPRPVLGDPRGLRDGEQFDKAAGKLDDPVLGSPRRRMPVARADVETDRPIQRRCGVEIMHRMNDVIDAARHLFHR